MHDPATSGPGEGKTLRSFRRRIAKFGALLFALTAASPSIAESGDPAAQPGVVIVWNVTKCSGGYRADVYSAHCEPGPAAAILDFNSRVQFHCVNAGPADVRWAIPNWSATDPKRGSPIAPSQVDWRLECWKAPLELDVQPGTAILEPPYTQSTPPNNYMTMNVVVLYDAARSVIKACLVPLFPEFPVKPACADAEIRS